jgi:hypothetical protein
VSGNSHTGTFSAYNPVASTGVSWPTLYQSFAPTLVSDIEAANFWYFDEGSSGTVGIATLLTFSDGTWVQDTLFTADPSYIQNQWAFRDLKPVLNVYSGKYLVEIGFFPDRSYNLYVDDVSILIPEPTTLLLLGMGGLLIRKRK